MGLSSCLGDLNSKLTVLIPNHEGQMYFRSLEFFWILERQYWECGVFYRHCQWDLGQHPIIKVHSSCGKRVNTHHKWNKDSL